MSGQSSHATAPQQSSTSGSTQGAGTQGSLPWPLDTQAQDPQAVGLALKVAQQRYQDERARRESLDTKAGVSLGFIGAILPLLFAVFTAAWPQQANGRNLDFVVALIALTSLALMTGAILCVMTLWLRSYSAPFGGKLLLSLAWLESEQDLTQRLLYVYAQAYERAAKQNLAKANYLRWVYVALALGAGSGLLALAAFVLIAR